MTDRGDLVSAEYLWDPAAAEPDADVATLEGVLATLRFQPRPAALSLPKHRSSRTARWSQRVVLAAALAVLALAGVAAYHWTWPGGKPWNVILSTHGESRRDSLPVGREMRLSAADRARVWIGRIGVMEVKGGSDLTLRATSSNRHRLKLDHGRLQVHLWAPSGSFVVRTPAGEVIDLGCEFDLRVEPSGVTRVHVETGWVQLDNAFGEALIPAGASAEMAPGTTPRVAVFDDAKPRFREGVRNLESRSAGEAPALDFLAVARPRDVFTLLVLASRAPGNRRAALLERAAQLFPPPAGVSPDAIAGVDAPLWRWIDALPLPRPKSWWRNWRDAAVWFHHAN